MHTDVDKKMDEACELLDKARAAMAVAVALYWSETVEYREYSDIQINKMTSSIATLDSVRQAIPRG